MIPFKQYITNPYDGLSGREETEWSNLWYDKANQQSDKRYLLIGDSTIRMVRGAFSRLTGCPVDMIGSSYDVDDVLFISLVDSFFITKMYHYEAIFIQIGHHSRFSKDGTEYKQSDLQRYRGGVISLIEYLKQFSSNIIIETIFDSFVYQPTKFDVFLEQFGLRRIIIKTGLFRLATRIGVRKEIKDNYINSVTDKKTSILYELAKHYSLQWLDINSIVQERHFVHIDHIHFEDNAKFFIARKMQECLYDNDK